MKYYIGVDVGGTNVAVGVVNENNEIVIKTSFPTNAPTTAEKLVNEIADTSKELCNKASVSFDDVAWIGIAAPGNLNPVEGTVARMHNLGIEFAHLTKLVEEKLPIKCYIENDANAAAYGEYIAGGAKGANSVICVTIGTGVGGGIIINGKIYSGFNFCGAEMGHIVMVYDGIECNCGRKGCMEKYCSATALIEQTKNAMLKNPDSLMWQESANIEDVSGRTAFNAMKKGDVTAINVVNQFISYLACGCTTFINIFQPDVLLIGGGISKEGEILLKPLREIINKEMFNHDAPDEKKTKILPAVLGNDAGIIGAAKLGNLYI